MSDQAISQQPLMARQNLTLSAASIDFHRQDSRSQPQNAPHKVIDTAVKTTTTLTKRASETDIEVASMQSSLSTWRKSKYMQRLYSIWVDSWLMEILSCVVASVVLVCLCATLRYFDGRVLTAMPLKININTLVAIYGAMIKTAILLPVAAGISELKWSWFTQARSLIDFEHFDIASRGPWGAALLVYNLRGRHAPTLGALVTILAIGIDPFSQQLILPVVCERRAVDAIARIASTNNLTQIGAPVGAGQPLAVLPEFQSAIYAGLFGHSMTLKTVCSTGNCTFPGNAVDGAFKTLGMDAKCVDISPEIATLQSKEDEIRQMGPWYIPALGNASTAVGAAGLVHTESTTKTSPFLRYWPASDDITFFSFSALIYRKNTTCHNATEAASSKSCLDALAVECRMWPAIQTVYAKIELSVLQEDVVHSEPLEFVPYDATPRSRSLLDSWLTIPKETIRGGKRVPCLPSLSYSPDTPVPVSNHTPWFADSNPVPIDLTWWANDCIFAISKGSIAVSWFLDSRYSGKSMVSPYGPRAPLSTSGDLWIKSLYTNGTASLSTVEANVRQLARSINIHLRNTKSTWDDQAMYVIGEAFRTETCIKVQWAWLLFTAGLVLATVTFLALTIWRTRRRSMLGLAKGAWKSSILAVLFSGLTEDLTRDYKMSKKSEMNRCAEGLKVELRCTGSGWQLEKS